MERVWVLRRLAVTLFRVDFVDPELVGEPDVRERGVRVEIKPVQARLSGSLYSSDTTTLAPALCRLDFLESAPGKADRMHWHPDMAGGEPGSRTFDVDMPADPRGWLVRFLRTGLRDHLTSSGDDVTAYDADLRAIAELDEEIGTALDAGLAWARQPWPEVEHDERGMASVG
jgi:hypothetical protein